MVNNANTSKTRGKPVGSKDKNPRKRRRANDGKEANTLPVEENKDIIGTPEVVQSHDIIETSKDVQ
ncbi:hypothetical protein PIB30_114508, partial [Stylosanthes scabra]|nr:hypothetical protein [Stylosanthes scabra]